MMKREQWSRGIEFELSFWRSWIETKGLSWPGDYAFRTNPGAELQWEIAGHLRGFGGGQLKILDVGAGPMTAVGKKFRGTPVDLTAVDALADAYDQLPFPPGLPLVRTQKCDSELLSEQFSPDSFDVVFARNTLDHGYDPVLAITEMIKVAKPGGLIVTEHHANEATAEKWQGFHQWNFRVVDSDFKIADRETTISVSEVISGLASIISISPNNGPKVNCTLRKHQGTPAVG
jgi:SAM-dependent methyltransferase